MKIEPRKKQKTPKYAAVLAALSATAMLTGCLQGSGDMQSCEPEDVTCVADEMPASES